MSVGSWEQQGQDGNESRGYFRGWDCEAHRESMAPRSRQLSGPETPLEFQALGKGLAAWKSFLSQSLPGQLSSGSLFTAPQGNGGGEAPPHRPSGSLSPGEQDKKLEGG